MELFSNYAQSYLLQSITDSDTTLLLPDTHGGMFSSPTGVDYEVLVITDGASWEVVKLIQRVGDTLTVERAYDGIARAWVSGAVVKNSVTKKTLENFIQEDEGSPANSLFLYHNFF